MICCLIDFLPEQSYKIQPIFTGNMCDQSSDYQLQLSSVYKHSKPNVAKLNAGNEMKPSNHLQNTLNLSKLSFIPFIYVESQSPK